MGEEVIEEVLWTQSAKRTFNNIIEYLRQQWSEKEAQKFIDVTNKMILSFKQHPEMCRPSLKRKRVHIGVLKRQTQLIYHHKSGKTKILSLPHKSNAYLSGR